MKKVKKIVGLSSFVLVGALILSNLNGNSANASTIGELLDNDNGALNSSQNAYTGTWTHEDLSGDYNGDDRVNTSGSGSYYWKFPYQSGYKTLSVYLDQAKFTNPDAVYILQDSTGNYSATYGEVNQNLAPAGWSAVNDEYGDGYVGYSWLRVLAGSGGYTGADAAEIDFN